jgi:hypothetical protein
MRLRQSRLHRVETAIYEIWVLVCKFACMLPSKILSIMMCEVLYTRFGYEDVQHVYL